MGTTSSFTVDNITVTYNPSWSYNQIGNDDNVGTVKNGRSEKIRLKSLSMYLASGYGNVTDPYEGSQATNRGNGVPITVTITLNSKTASVTTNATVSVVTAAHQTYNKGNAPLMKLSFSEPPILNSGQTYTITSMTWSPANVLVWDGERGGTLEWEPDYVDVTKVELNHSHIALSADSGFTMDTTCQLSATITPSNATDKTVTWSSSNSNVASVDSNGKVTGKGLGTATITCTSNATSKKSDTCTVWVFACPTGTATITSPTTEGKWYGGISSGSTRVISFNILFTLPEDTNYTTFSSLVSTYKYADIEVKVNNDTIKYSEHPEFFCGTGTDGAIKHKDKVAVHYTGTPKSGTNADTIISIKTIFMTINDTNATNTNHKIVGTNSTGTSTCKTSNAWPTVSHVSGNLIGSDDFINECAIINDMIKFVIPSSRTTDRRYLLNEDSISENPLWAGSNTWTFVGTPTSTKSLSQAYRAMPIALGRISTYWEDVCPYTENEYTHYVNPGTMGSEYYAAGLLADGTTPDYTLNDIYLVLGNPNATPKN